MELKCRSVTTLASHLRDHGVTETTKFDSEDSVAPTTLKGYWSNMCPPLTDDDETILLVCKHGWAACRRRGTND